MSKLVFDTEKKFIKFLLKKPSFNLRLFTFVSVSCSRGIKRENIPVSGLDPDREPKHSSVFGSTLKGFRIRIRNTYM
jgi:hypothetical protein